MVKEVKRMNYYNGLFLKEEDFITEQEYHIRMRRLLNWNMNKVYGVIDGLVVEPVENSKKYRITAGMALARIEEEKGYCAEIVLTDDIEEEFSTKSAGDFYITIAYDEVKGDKDETKGSEEIHWIERPKLEVKSESPDDPEKEIILAKITVPESEWKSESKSIDTSDRKEIGPAIRTINDKVGIGTSIPSEKLEVNGAVSATEFLGDGSKLTGISTGKWSDAAGGTIFYEKGNVGIGTKTPSQKLEVNGAVSATEFLGDGSKLTGISTGKWSDAAGGTIFYEKGNVGIGTKSPKAKLHATGDLVLGFDKNNQKFIFHSRPNTGDFLQITHDDAKGSWDWRKGITLRRGGNVGIGTTAPSQKLEVNGNIKISGKIIQENWTRPSLKNGWVIYSNIFNPPGYFRDTNGIVHLRGLIKNGEIGKPIFTLPAGYRPAFRELQPVQTNANTIGRCDILNNGDVIPIKGDKGWFSLDGITFRAKEEVKIIKDIKVAEFAKNISGISVAKVIK